MMVSRKLRFIRINLRGFTRMNLWDTLEYLILFITFIFGQSVWIRMNYNPDIYEYLTIAASCIALVSISFAWYRGRLKLYKRDMFRLIYILALFFLYCLLSSFKYIFSFRITLLRVILPFAVFYFYFLRPNSFYGFMEKYARLVYYFAAISVVLYFLGSILHILPALSAKYHWVGTTLKAKNYMHLMYECQNVDFFGTTFVRNCGIFCEAPSYAVPLLMALAYELFYNGKMNLKRIIVLLLTMITTYSTKALVIACVAVLLKVILFSLGRGSNLSKSQRTVKNLVKLTMPVVFVGLVVVAAMILNQKLDSASFADRMDNIQASLKAFFHSPLVGVGLGNERAITRYCRYITKWQGLSMGATTLLAEGGLLLTYVYLLCFAHAVKAKPNHLETFCFGFVFLLVLFSSNIPYFLFTVILIAAGYAHRRQ